VNWRPGQRIIIDIADLVAVTLHRLGVFFDCLGLQARFIDQRAAAGSLLFQRLQRSLSALLFLPLRLQLLPFLQFTSQLFPGVGYFLFVEWFDLQRFFPARCRALMILIDDLPLCGRTLIDFAMDASGSGNGGNNKQSSHLDSPG